MHYASQGGNLPVVQYLLQNGGSITRPNKSKLQPFHKALESGDAGLTEALITLGCVEMAEENPGGPPGWDYARKIGVSDEVSALMEDGPDPSPTYNTTPCP